MGTGYKARLVPHACGQVELVRRVKGKGCERMAWKEGLLGSRLLAVGVGFSEYQHGIFHLAICARSVEVELILGRKAHEVLKWVHILASNAKAFILGTYHGLDGKHLQSYLDEYCFRFS